MVLYTTDHSYLLVRGLCHVLIALIALIAPIVILKPNHASYQGLCEPEIAKKVMVMIYILRRDLFT